MNAERAIKRLGGGTKLAGAILATTGVAVDRNAIYEWKKNGIPRRWRPVVAKLLKERADQDQGGA